MDTQAKLDILSRDAQYDLSCSCGTKDPAEHRRRSNDHASWLYPTTTASGGAGIILKTLLGNRCVNDCAYCPLRCGCDFKSVALTPGEIASFFYELAAKRPLIGLFLSSAVLRDGDTTMELLIESARLLRQRYRYRGYIHLKVIPGCSTAAIDEALKYASALSLNIEVPSEDHFSALSSTQEYQRDIIGPLTYLAQRTARGAEYERVTTSTQFIVGASDESDKEILQRVGELYRSLGVGRIYYSAYQQALGETSLIPKRSVVTSLQGELFDDLVPSHHLDREHRLYQADYLVRSYGFEVEELIFAQEGNLSLLADPKQVWAEANAHLFPLSINSATREELLRVPELGPVRVGRILKQRREGRIASLAALALPSTVISRLVRYLTP
jgi:predicted DNA-binding helix-hairpin-helix protein